MLKRNIDCGIVLSNNALEACDAANKVPRTRAAVCYDAYSAEVRVNEEGMNVLVLAFNLLDDDEILAIVSAYLTKILPFKAAENLFLHRWHKVFSYIEDNIARELPVTELAPLCNLSPDHFSRLFKKSTGTTPHQYVLRRRVECAQKSLLETGTPLAEIARRLGFKHQSHFTQIFRRTVGVGPKRYRTRGHRS